ncbi:DUF7033 domain-containing protein [Tenacibaculum maritimum]
MILIYTHKITPRVRYIFKHIFTRTLKISIDFTSKIETFVAHNGPKLSYTKVPLGKEFFIRSNALLFEQGVNDLEINMGNWDTVPCFFSAGSKSVIPFDIFAASFYLITRYEEYLPHVKDKHGRFSAEKSIAYKYGFLEKPIIDIWAFKLLKALKERFPTYQYKERNFQFISTIDVDNAYAYRHKSFVRTIGGFLNDVGKLNLFNLWNRMAIVFRIKKDPFQTFDKLISLKKEYDVRTIFFFLIGDYTTFDTNVSSSKNNFQLLIKEMVDYARVGLHPSYFTMQDASMLKKEKERMERITNMPITRSRQH